MQMRILLLVVVPLVLSTFELSANSLPDDIHEVRAFVYDYTQERKNMTLLKGGKIHSGVINKGGTRLAPKQVEALKNALRSKKELIPGAFCYMPHHGFIFYNSKGKALGHIELCFQCGNVDSSPMSLSDYQWDWDAIEKILKDLKIPVLKKDEDYTKLFLATKANKPTLWTPAPVGC